ncbi:MAG: YbaN family protein [Pseudomonadota bacterium]
MKRRAYFAAGLLFFGIGAAGIPLPLLPTVPFWLLAVFFFARSNEEWEQRILNHPQWGPQIREWRERRAISRRAKVLSIGSIAAGVGFTSWTIGFPWAWISLAVLAICGAWIATRPE